MGPGARIGVEHAVYAFIQEDSITYLLIINGKEISVTFYILSHTSKNRRL